MGTQDYEKLIDLYHNINIYCLVGALIFLALAVFLFFWLKIPQVLGELTGRTAQKAIAEMLAENAESGSLTSVKVGHDGRRQRKARTGTLGTGRLQKNTGRTSKKFTEDITGSNLNSFPNAAQAYGTNGAAAYEQTTMSTNMYEGSEPTGSLDNYGSQPTDVLDSYGSQPTDVLDSYGSQPTDVLDNYGSQPTDVLSSYVSQPVNGFSSYESAPVYQAPESETMVLDQSVMNMNTGFVFQIERSIVEIHTNEVI